jgi:hypothetical protein
VKGTRVAFAIGFLVMATLVSDLPRGEKAYAAIDGCGDPENWVPHFDGKSAAFQSDTRGSKATIDDYRPDLCGPEASSLAWAMISASSTVHAGDGWAQVGYGRFGCSSGMSECGFLQFAQYTKWCQNNGSSCAPGYPKTAFGYRPLGPDTYKNTFNLENGLIHMTAGGTDIAATDFNPLNVWGIYWQPQFYGEAWQCHTDVPGVNSSRVAFKNLQKEVNVSPGNPSGSFVDIEGFVSGTVDCTRYNRNGLGGTNFEIWTQPLS